MCESVRACLSACLPVCLHKLMNANRAWCLKWWPCCMCSSTWQTLPVVPTAPPSLKHCEFRYPTFPLCFFAFSTFAQSTHTHTHTHTLTYTHSLTQQHAHTFFLFLTLFRLPLPPLQFPPFQLCRSTPTAAFAACTSATAFTARTSCLQSLSCTSRCAARIGRTQRHRAPHQQTRSHRDPLLKNNADFTPFVALPISSRFPLCLFFNLRVGTRVTRLLALVLFLSSFLPPLLSGFELCFAPYTLFLFLLCAFLLQFALVLVALCLAKLRSHMSFFSLFLQCWCCCCCC